MVKSVEPYSHLSRNSTSSFIWVYFFNLACFFFPFAQLQTYLIHDMLVYTKDVKFFQDTSD
jgi:hypothetical protein